MESKRIKSLTETDRMAFRMLAHAGNATTGTLEKIGLSATRIENLKRDHLIVSMDRTQKHQHKNPDAVWALTKGGKVFSEKNLDIQRFASGTNAPKHNCVVAEKYAEISGRSDIARIMDEHECRSYIKENLAELCYRAERADEYYEWKERLDSGRLSMPDITIITTTETIECIEVTTDNYGAIEIESKMMTVELLCAEYTQIDS